METNKRRDFLRKSSMLALGGIGFTTLGSISGAFAKAGMAPEAAYKPFELPNLPYALDALEPHIDKTTMMIHHTKHHMAYITKLNAEMEKIVDRPELSDILNNISKYNTAIRNNAGGHYNHSFFWKLMKPNGGGAPTGALGDSINSVFGSFEQFKVKFSQAAMWRFGSGWAWLVSDKGKLVIGSTANQDNPLMDISELRGTPVLALDVWEHAYYLKYQNLRADYISAWWNVVNWEQAAANFQSSK